MFGSMIKESLEKEGSRVLGFPVRVESASLSPFSGQLVVQGMSAGEPEIFRISRLEAVTSLSAPLDLGEVVADGVDVYLEIGRSGSNLGRLRRGMSAGPPGLTIRRLLMRNASVRAKLFGRMATFPLPELVLDRVDLRGLVQALVSKTLLEARRRAWRIKSMPRRRKRASKRPT